MWVCLLRMVCVVQEEGEAIIILARAPLNLMLVRPVLATEIPRTKEGLVDFVALNYTDFGTSDNI